MPDSMSDGNAWPRVSIVTPSYNHGQFIEEAIRSVLLQGYPDIEYIIIDGGSTDNSVEIIRKYEKYIAYWVSESDRGQSHAINKGLARASGEILSYLNSDDLLLVGALLKVASHSLTHPEAEFIYGGLNYIDSSGTKLSEVTLEAFSLRSLLVGTESRNGLHVAFIKREAFERIGPFNENLLYAFDYEYCVRAARSEVAVSVIGMSLSAFRVHALSKSCMCQGELNFREAAIVCRKSGGGYLSWAYRSYWRVWLRNCIERSPFAFLLIVYRQLKRSQNGRRPEPSS